MNLKRKVSRRIERGRHAHMWNDTVKVQPAIESMKAGLASHENGELEAAISHYRAAIAYYPALAQAHNAPGVALHDSN